MPRLQTAVVASYEVGMPLPGKSNPVLQFLVEQGADLQITQEAYDQTFTVTCLVSPDGVNWNAPTVANNGSVYASITANPNGHVATTPLRLRPGLDNYVSFSVIAGYGVLQIRGGDRLQIQVV